VTTEFGAAYAEAYDALYADKDYDAECATLVSAFAETRPVASVLDLGCGTGAHAARLSAMGYSVVGVDRSKPMLDIARDRARAGIGSDVRYVEGDIRSVVIGETFDAVICMFAVLGYQTTDADVESALGTVRRHLRPGGIFVFDVWNGTAVESIGPSTRTKTVPSEGGQIERTASALLDTRRHICTVSYVVKTRHQDGAMSVVEEDHLMRYFFADELEDFLDAAGLILQDVSAFPEKGPETLQPPWNILISAVAK
jgi:SAM-dependent methyltransferase